MKRPMTLSLMTAALLAGCGGETNDNILSNNASEMTGNEVGNVVLNASAPDANLQSGITQTPIQNETVAPLPPPSASNRIGEPPPARRPSVPPPQPEPDPHAGHDMGNMANMHH